jgi:hypothetical protein
MKTIKHLTTLILFTAIALLLLTCRQAMGQSIFQSGFDAAVTDGAAGGGLWRATTGNYNIASYDYVYNFNTETNSLGAGLILGGDYMWSGSRVHIQNDIKGGFSINYKGDLRSIGMTNTTFRMVGGNAIATPRQKGAGVGNITFVNLDLTFHLYKSINLHIDPGWQTRVGQGDFDRNYGGLQLFFSMGF